MPNDATLHEPLSDSPTAAHRPRRSFLRTTAIVVVSALVLSLLIRAFLVQAFFIPSASMEDTLVEGERVVVSRLVPDAFDVHRGDVVVFKDPGGWLPPPALPGTDDHLIKRAIGVPGDHVVCCDADGQVSVNEVSIDETYLRTGSIPSELPFDVTVPEGMLFVMGDSRQNSADSRHHAGSPGGGFVPLDNVVGTAFATVWPLSDLGLLRNPGDVFADVPDPVGPVDEG